MRLQLTSGENSIMLTKDQIKYFHRKGKITPKLIDTSDKELVSMAEDMIQIFKLRQGCTSQSLVSDLEDLEYVDHSLFTSFKKLLEDRCSYDDSAALSEIRQNWLSISEKCRQESDLKITSFESLVEKEAGVPINELRSQLYADLPEFKTINKFKDIDGIGLLHRYNLALLQGLVLHSSEISISLASDQLSQYRGLLRLLRFNRLLGKIGKSESVKKGYTLTISGPLSLFQSSQAYGLRLANFIPWIMHFPEWSICSELMIKKKKGVLSIDHTSGIKTHYKEPSGYIPPEFASLLDFFQGNSKESGWKALPGNEVLDLGKQNWSFPDFTFVGPDRQKVHCELFHKWHKGEVSRRLTGRKGHLNQILLIGLCSSFKKDNEISNLVDESLSKNGKIFWFRDFPAPRVLLTQLQGVSD